MIAAGIVVLALLGGGAFLWKRGRALAGQRVTSLAVVPFRDLNATNEGRILADGISELIAARLSEVRELRVSSPFTGAHVSDSDDVRKIASKRGVNAVVRGSVQRNGTEVRVSYSLIDAGSGRTLTAGTATRPATDLFALEDVVAEDLARALGRESRPRPQQSAAPLAPGDQRQFVESLGLLQNVQNERAVDRAIDNLRSVLRNARDSGAVNALLARALTFKAVLAKRPALLEEAMIYARRGVSLGENDPDSHITLGRVHSAMRSYDEAAASHQRALALHPDHPDALIGLAEAYEGLGRNDETEKMIRKALTLRPDAPAVYSRYGTFCYRQGRFEEAVTHFRRAAELAPEFWRAYSNLGVALQGLRRYDEAVAAYRKSLALEPSASGWSNLGTLQFSLGQYVEAQKSFEKAVALAPSDYLMWSNLGDACRALGAKECADRAWTRTIAAARDIVAARKNDVFARAILASALAKNGNLDEAQTEIRHALESNPTNSRVLYQAAIVAALRGSSDSAISWLERAVAAGYPAAEAASDPVFGSLRDLPAFRKAVKSEA